MTMSLGPMTAQRFNYHKLGRLMTYFERKTQHSQNLIRTKLSSVRTPFHFLDHGCQAYVFQGVTLRLLNCEVFKIVLLPLLTARPM